MLLVLVAELDGLLVVAVEGMEFHLQIFRVVLEVGLVDLTLVEDLADKEDLQELLELTVLMQPVAVVVVVAEILMHQEIVVVLVVPES